MAKRRRVERQGYHAPVPFVCFSSIVPPRKGAGGKGEDKKVTDHEEKEEEEMDSWSGSHEHL